jgi:release factor glutamine methyltransferase
VTAVSEVLREGALRLEAQGVPDAADESARLWARLTGRTLGEVWLGRDDGADPELRERFLDAVVRWAGGEPAAYVTGRAGFRTLELEIDPRALIPRPETEGLVEHVLEWGRRRDPEAWGAALDVGTGTGCIALSLAVEGRFGRVVAADASEDALALARGNAERVAPPRPVELRHGSLLEPVAGEVFDVIVSNPPYVTAGEFEKLEVGVRCHEPRGALVSGEEGLEHIRRLLEGAGPHLATHGLLALEVDCTRAEAAATLARRAGWRDVRLEPDVFGRLRYLLTTKELER